MSGARDDGRDGGEAVDAFNGVAAPAPDTAPAHAFEVRERVRWEDVDLVGIMRYSAYTRVFDVAEAELFRALALGYPDGPARMGGWLLRKVLHVEYLAPARFDAELRVRTWPGRIGSTSLTLHFEVTDGAAAVRHAHGHFVLVFVDGEMRKRELPDVLVAAVRRLG